MSAEEASRIARTAERVRRGTRMPLKVLVPTVAALGVGGGFAAAAIPGSNGVITACYNTSTSFNYSETTTNPSDEGSYTLAFLPLYGSVRIIDPSAQAVTAADGTPVYNSSCAPNETTISWNQQGPQGVPGTNGVDGKNGINGTNGENGKNGQNGSITGAATFELDAGGGTELFAKLASISGTSKVDGEAGLIKLETFAFGAQSPVLSTSKGSAISKQSVQTFELTKKDDKTDAELFQDWQQGKTIAKMEVQAEHVAKGQSSDVATFTFTDVKLKSIRQKGGQETVVGVFTKMQSSFGSGSTKVSGSLNPGASWDLTSVKTS